MVINHLLTGMILQVAAVKRYSPTLGHKPPPCNSRFKDLPFGSVKGPPTNPGKVGLLQVGGSSQVLPLFFFYRDELQYHEIVAGSNLFPNQDDSWSHGSCQAIVDEVFFVFRRKYLGKL